MGVKEYAYRGWQNGVMIFEVGGTILDLVQNEARHYAMKYQSEGPLEIKPKRGTPPLSTVINLET